MGLEVGAEAGGVVAAHLVAARAERRGAVVLADDDVVVRRKAAAEVGAYGRYENHEEILVGGVNAYLGSGTDEQRADVERGAAFVRRNEILVEFHNLLHHLLEAFRREFGHQYAPAGRLQAFGVVLHAESADFAVGTAEGFQALEGFLAIVEGGGCHVDIDGFGGGYFNFSPFAVTVVATNVVVCLDVAKLQVGPVDILHNADSL